MEIKGKAILCDSIFTIFALLNNKIVKRYKVKEIIALLKSDGWYMSTYKGTSHRQFVHSTKKGKVTVNGKFSEVLGQELLNSIWKQAGWK